MNVHGSENSYREGCRCDLCVTGHWYYAHWKASSRAISQREVVPMTRRTRGYVLPADCLERRAAIDPTSEEPF